MRGEVFTGKRADYKIGDPVGGGGFGSVYKAEDSFGNIIAVKLIDQTVGSAATLSFEREIQAVTGLSHLNLLRIIDWGSKDINGSTLFFVASEFCADGNLRGFIRKSPDPDQIVGAFQQILSGLAALHQQALHRDLKPENVLIDGGTLKVGDFGMSRLLDARTGIQTFKGGGTPLYMAPETWKNQGQNQATDLYSIGVMLFEALTGQLPFNGTTHDELREAHLYQQAPRIRVSAPHIPDYIDGIVKKLLSKSQMDRFQTATEVSNALTQRPQAAPASLNQIAQRMRAHHDQAEARALGAAKEAHKKMDEQGVITFMEATVVEELTGIIEQINGQLAETKITVSKQKRSTYFRFGNRELELHFFDLGELYENPKVPGRVERLRQSKVIHGGFLEIHQDGKDREGWNLVLLRPSVDSYGEWNLVETRSGLGAILPIEPVATGAQLFADNLSNHLGRVMHIYNLSMKRLEKADLERIVDMFIP